MRRSGSSAPCGFPTTVSTASAPGASARFRSGEAFAGSSEPTSTSRLLSWAAVLPATSPPSPVSFGRPPRPPGPLGSPSPATARRGVSACSSSTTRTAARLRSPTTSTGVSTGSLALDLALGIGGLPRGRIVEVFGPEASGKTTLVYHAIAEAQRRGGICAFVDAEHSMDPQYARRIGVDIDQLLVSQPDTGEQALEIVELLIRSGALDIVAIDSVAALVPKAEIEGEMGDSHVGLQARLMSQALRKLAGTLNRTETICIFTNQLREKIGVMFGNPETTPGGRALKFYASVRLDIRRIETLKDGVEAIGNRVRVKVAKNKVAPPFKQAEMDIMYGKGISWEGTVLDAGLERKIVTKSGSYFSFDEERPGQGRQNATAFLKEHPDVVQQILQGIQGQMGEGQIVSARLLAQVESTEATPVEAEEEATAAA